MLVCDWQAGEIFIRITILVFYVYGKPPHTPLHIKHVFDTSDYLLAYKWAIKSKYS